MDQPTLVSYAPRMVAAYREFAITCFGPGAYQASPRYLDWLYQANGAPAEPRSFPVAVVGDRVVGCIHKMGLPWVIGGVPCRVPTLHNLMVDERYRSGAGFWLLKRSLYGEQHAVIPGVVRPLSEAYDQMGCQQVHSRWFRKVLRPIAGSWSLLRSRVTGRSPDARRLPDGEVCGYRLSTDPPPGRLAQIAAELRRQDGPDHVDWTESLVRWRFFHELGPRHVLIDLDEAWESFALVSLGPRGGVIAGRLTVLSAGAMALGVESVRKVCRSLAHCGAHAALATTANPALAELLRASRFQEYTISPSTYFYHRDRSVVQQTVFGPDISDIGFEAIQP